MKWLQLVLVLFISSLSFSAPPNEVKLDSQGQYEREIEAVVRSKMYYKSGRFEVAGFGGVMPYDSVVNHYLLGGKLTWHMSDHYGWEVLDAAMSFPSVTSFTTDLVQAQGISNLQASKVKLLLTSNFILSPFYGKIHFFGSQMLYFDIYLALGGGLASTETFRLSSTGVNAVGTETTIKTGMDPVVDFGVGFKIFLNPAMGLLLDLRDYIVFSETYGSRSPKSNYTVYVGLNFFLPTFG